MCHEHLVYELINNFRIYCKAVEGIFILLEGAYVSLKKTGVSRHN